ncbi:ribosome-inactivating family protein [Streptomyces sp. NPDC091280]|uniref:ribosome-inactivating family protein n=1 Tax=unclassified Streptomyces TaxID=2593676 RepID=UPI0038140E40
MTSFLRRRLSRCVVLATILLALCAGLVPGTTGVASADPTAAKVDYITWDITDLTAQTPGGRTSAAQSYTAVIDQLRGYAGHTYANAVGETTATGNEIIGINLNRNNLLVGRVFLWARSLYVIGFWEPHGYRFFDDPANNAAADIMGIAQPLRLPWTGNYATIPGGTQRATLTYGGGQLNNAVNAVADMVNALNGTNEQRTALARHMVRLIQALSEAARFGTVRNLVTDNLRNGVGNAMGADNVVLENNWGHISDFIHGLVNAGTAPPITLNGVEYFTLAGIMREIVYVMIRNQNRAGGS